MEDKVGLRARDFWTSLFLIAVSVLFLWRTSLLPFYEAKAAGVDSAQWFNSAAVVPFGIFGLLLLLALALLGISIRDGGASRALNSLSAFRGTLFGRSICGWDELRRIGLLSLILIAYIGGLVPRVDFILASGLVITAMTYGFHSGRARPMVLCAAAAILPAVYAVVMHPLPADWARPHDDDFLTLAAWLALTAAMFGIECRRGGIDRVIRATPLVSLLIPLILVIGMAFGFRQNVPNRTGLVFSQIEYHYYVTLKRMLKGE